MASLFTTCSKDEDTEYSAKELVTFDLNDEINADSLESYVIWLENMGTRFALADNRRSIAVSLRNRLRKFGYSNAALDSFMISKTYNGAIYQVWQFNVVATLEGSGSSDSISIVGGHYDNNIKSGDPFLKVPGANDNASGVAAALEIARVMKKNNYLPDGDIRFIAFACEELGLLGSYNYAGKASENNEKIRMMLNNDMIAYQNGTDKSAWVVNIMDYANSLTLRAKAEKLCQKFTVLKFRNDNTYNRQSDSYPFYAKGFKPLFFFSDVTDPDYHTPDDLASNCNFEYCREIVKLNCAILVDAN
jgi:Zn-dependent M28 family amino/carboxypeptidase